MSNKRKLVPKKRFLEFQGAEYWEEEKLGKLFSFKSTNSLSRNKLNLDQGTVKNIHYGDIHTKFASHFNIEKEEVPYIVESEPLEKIKSENFCKEGDVIFADASEDIDDIGKCIEIINLNNEKLLSGLHTVLARQKKDRLVIGFAGHLFQSHRMRTKIQNEAQGAKVLGISGRRLASIDICYPQGEKEQQKIADCLSSMDELIAAEGQKLEALKDHKKGLIQKIFPIKSNNSPDLRFPEFRNRAPWKESEIGKHIEEFRKKSTFQDEFEVLTSSRNGLIRQKDYYDKSRLIERNNIGFNVIPQNYITYRSRSDNSLFFFNQNQLGITGVISVYYPVFTMKTGSNRFFVELLARFAEFIGRHSVGNAQKVLSLNELKKIRLPIPEPDEQKKIANFLLSVDELVDLQSKKIDALRDHKKGLMQQLFPSAEEVNG